MKKNHIRKSDLALLGMLLPGSIYLLINNYAPMGGLFIAFKRINFKKGIFRSDWVGLSNFEFLFKTKEAWVMTRNTLLYNLVFIALNIILGVTFAILLNEIRNKVLKKSYQTILLMPQIISMVIVSYMAFAFLSSDNGFINLTILKNLGRAKISWYSKAGYWPFIIVFVQAWKNIGYNTILFLASVVGIDPSLYDAAKVDGASRIRQIFYITLALMRPAMITLGLLMVGKIFYSDFGLFYQLPMNSGPLFGVTQTIDTYVYRGLSNVSNLGMASAASFYQSFVGFAVVLASNLVVRRIDPDSALF